MGPTSASGYDVVPAAGDPIKAGEIKAAHLERILAVARQQYDAVVFDIGQDINPATLAVLDHSNLIYAVMRRSLAHLRAGRRLFDLCQSLSYHTDRGRLVLNGDDRHASIAQRTLEDAFGVRVAHVLPLDAGPVRDASEQGEPVAQLAPNSAIVRALADMARQLYPDTQPRRDNLLRKLFGQNNQVHAPKRAPDRHRHGDTRSPRCHCENNSSARAAKPCPSAWRAPTAAPRMVSTGATLPAARPARAR